MEIKRNGKKVVALLCSLIMIFAFAVPNFAANSSTTKTVYVDVEKNITGQNVIQEPVKVVLDENKTIADATKEAVGANRVRIRSTQYGNYIEAFKDDTLPFIPEENYEFYDELYELTDGIVFRTDIPNQPIVNEEGWLAEKEYNDISGWMFTVDNTMVDANNVYYTGDTKLSDLPDNAVIRWEYSMAVGCDIGLEGYLPNGTLNEWGYYNWNTEPTPPFFNTRVDKSELIRKMADHENKNSAEYLEAMKVLRDLTTEEYTQADVDEIADSL